MPISEAIDIEKVVGDVEAIVSSKYVSTNLYEKIKNCTVPRPYEVEREILPYVVVLPGSSDEISEILKYANKGKIPVFVRASGTSLSAHSRPHTHGIVINTSRMTHMQIDEEQGFFECGPGITAGKVAEQLGKIDCFLPMWPGSMGVASMGGLIANNTSGHIVDLCFGKPNDFVAGLEVVLPNGDILETGTKGLRRIAGTDLTKFFVGSDGILGVVTKIRMVLVPQFEQAYGMAVFEDLSDMARAVQRLFAERHPAPLFMEMMEREVAKIGYEIKEMAPPNGSVLLFSEIGFNKDVALEKVNTIIELCRKEGAEDVESIRDEDTWHKVVAAREVIGPYLMQKNGGVINSAELVSNLKDLVAAMDDAVNFNHGLPILGELKNYLYGHIGALTFHPSFVFPTTWDAEKKRMAVQEVFQKEAELNLKYDTCGGEWGQFSLRTPFFKQKYGQVGYGLVRKFKEVVDPNNILNPGILEGMR